MTVDEEIAALRSAIGARNDVELAELLGIKKSAISQWRGRSSVPAKYRAIYIKPSDAEIADAVTKAFRIVMFGKPEHSFWLAAAVSAIPHTVFGLGDETEEQRGLRLERAILDGMNVAMIATLRHLRKEVCEGEDDYRRLVQALRDHSADDFARIAARREPPTGD
jgi:hypothetical protein